MKKIATALLALILLYSCGIGGIHFNLKNPKKEGKYPKFSEETVRLGTLNELRSNFDVSKYDIDILFQLDQKSIDGKVAVYFTALTDIDSIQLDLHKNLKITALKSLDAQGQNLQYTRKERALYIALDKPLKRGESSRVWIEYNGKPMVAKKAPWKGGFVWNKDKNKDHWVGVACESEGASIWFPCKDHTSDEPDEVNLTYRIPQSKLKVVGNGQFVSETTEAGITSFKWKISHPINLYNVTFYIGNFSEITETYKSVYGKEINCSYFVLAGNEEMAKKHFKQVPQQLQFFEKTYVEFPFFRDGYRLVESPYEGMEHQSAIAYGHGYQNSLEGKFDYIILHESGHEWFGNAITAKDMKDVWLQEGITTYNEALFLEKVLGKKAALQHLMVYRFTIKNKLPLVGPEDRRYFSYKDSDVYVKGAWVMHSLRYQLKDDALFFAIIKAFYEEFKYKVCSSQDFIDVVNRLSKSDYTWFFNQYLYNRKVPVFNYYLDSDGYLYYSLTEVNPDFDKLSIKLEMAREETDLYLNPGTEVQRIQVNESTMSTITIQDLELLIAKKKNKDLVKRYHDKH